MFDCNSFLRRKNWTQKDLAKRLNVGTSTIGMWCTGKSTPSYAVIVELFKLGMTLNEMFGEDIRSIILDNSKLCDCLVPLQFDSPEFMKGVAKAIEQLKEMGKV